MKIKIKNVSPSVRKIIDDVLDVSTSKEHSLAIARTIVADIRSTGENVTKATVDNAIDRLYASVEVDTDMVRIYARGWNSLYTIPKRISYSSSNESSPLGSVFNVSGFAPDEVNAIIAPSFAVLCNNYREVLDES